MKHCYFIQKFEYKIHKISQSVDKIHVKSLTVFNKICLSAVLPIYIQCHVVDLIILYFKAGRFFLSEAKDLKSCWSKLVVLFMKALHTSWSGFRLISTLPGLGMKCLVFKYSINICWLEGW